MDVIAGIELGAGAPYQVLIDEDLDMLPNTVLLVQNAKRATRPVAALGRMGPGTAVPV